MIVVRLSSPDFTSPVGLVIEKGCLISCGDGEYQTATAQGGLGILNDKFDNILTISNGHNESDISSKF